MVIEDQCQKPQGDEGREVIKQMGEHHRELTIWGLANIPKTSAKEILDIGCGWGSMEIEDFGAKIGEIVLDKEHLAEWSEKIIVTDRGPTRTMAPRPKETLEFRGLPDVSDKTDVTEFYTNVMAAIDGEADLLVTPEQVYRIMQIIDAARESDKTGASVRVDL